MSITLDLDTNRWISCQSNTVERKLQTRQKELLEMLDYNICISMTFNSSKNMAFIAEVTTKGKGFNRDVIPNTIFLNKARYTYLRRLVEEKNIIENHSTKGISQLLGDIESEVFIPIFRREDSGDLNLELVGCLYLGSGDIKRFPTEFLPRHKGINQYISDISQTLTLCYMMDERINHVFSMVNIFMDILERKDPYLSSHSYNVANWCREIGIRLGYSRKQLGKLIFAGLLHDVGKAMISDDVLAKTTKLTEDEISIIKKHPIDSCRIAENIFNQVNELKDIPNIIKCHHERYDGKGYPDGLKGDQVPMDSYIIGIADAVDAMMTNRPYKRAKLLNATIGELYRNKGKQFHPKLVDIMVERLVQAQKQLKENTFLALDQSSLIISFSDDMMIVSGTLLQIEDYYIFRPNDIEPIDEMDISKVTNIEMIIKDLNNLNYYEIKLEDFADKMFYISSIKLLPDTNSFNLFWDLEGILQLPNGMGEISIGINRIGGDRLSFYLRKDQALRVPYMELLKIRVLFEELDIDITGNIIKNYSFGPYRHLDFVYTNMPDSTRDSIYRQLFKKQIQLRQAVSQHRI